MHASALELRAYESRFSPAGAVDRLIDRGREVGCHELHPEL